MDNTMQDPGQPGNAMVAVGGPLPPAPMTVVSPLAKVHELEGFEEAVITPAYMTIIQNGSRDEEATPGTFKDMITGQSFRSIQIVPLKIICNPGPRVMYKEDAPFGSDPLCRSNDGVTPDPRIENPPSSKCATCKFGDLMWKTWRTTGKPTTCKEKAKILFVARDSGLPFMLSAGGRSVPAVKLLLKSIMRNAAMLYARGEKTGIYDYTTEMFLKRETSAKGVYYVLQFKPACRVRNVGEFGPLYQELVKRQDVLATAPDDESSPIDAPAQASHVVGAEVLPTDEAIPF